MSQPRQRQPKGRPGPRLPAAARWTLRGLATLPLVGLTVSAGVYFSSVYHLLRAHLVPIAEAELTRQTGHEVRIGAADFGKRGVLILSDIAIANKATFAQGGGEATLSARRLTVDYDFHALVFDSGNAAHAIGDITLDQPSLLVERLSKTQFNFSDLLKSKTTKKSKPFVGRILVHDGLLRFRDFAAPDRGKRPALNTLTAVEGTIDFFSTRNVYFDVRGRGAAAENRFDRLLVNGDVSRLVAGRYRGHVVATNADAAYWTDYFKAFPQARIIRGRADADVSLANEGATPAPGRLLDLSGNIAVRHVTVLASDKKALALPLQDLTGAASFTGAGLSLDAHATLAGQALAVSGTVFDFKHPQIAASASSPRLDPVRLAAALPVLKLPAGLKVSPGPVRASFTGTPANPTITVGATVPAIAYAGNRATNVTGQVTYANKVLSVPSVTFRLNGTGRGALRGTVDTTGPKPVLLLAGALRGVDLAGLRLPPAVKGGSLNLGGLADVQFLADNQGRPLSVVANVSATNLRLKQTTLRSLAGRVAWTQGGAITLTRLVARDASGTAAVSGTVPAGGPQAQWGLTVKTAGLDIASLLRPYSKLALSGRAALDGRIVGPAAAPRFVGAARLIEPRFGRYAADLITGNLAVGLTGVRLQDVTLRRFPTEARLSGTVTQLANADPLLALNVHVSKGDVADFLRLAESASAPSPKTARTLTASLPNLSGTATGDFHISGRLRAPAVSGHADVSDATVGNFRLDRVAADVSYSGGVLRVQNGVVRSEAATLTASGERTAGGLVSARFAAAGLDLARFDSVLTPSADVEGTVAFAGRLGGTPSAPHIALTSLTVPDLVVDGQTFAPLSLAARYDDGVLTQTGAPWRFIVSAPSDYAGEAGGPVEYDVNALRLTLPTPTHPRRATALSLAAAIPTSAPERLSHVFATIRASRFARTLAGRGLLARIANLPQPLSGTFALPHISLDGPLSALTARADLSARALTFGATKVAGLTASLAYTAGRSPSGSVTAAATDLLAAGVPVGAASADVDYKNRTVTVHSLRATNARAFLSASGTADLDGNISASLDASNVPLALLGTAFPPAVPFLRALPREVSALSVNVSGPTRSPNLVGSVSLSNPEGTTPKPVVIQVAAGKKRGKKPDKGAPTEVVAAPDAPAYALDSIRSGTITLASSAPDAPKVLTVSDLSAFKNGRLVATLSGSVPLINAANRASAALLPDQDLRAVLKVQDLSALAAFSPGLVDPKKTGGRFSLTANFGGGGLSGLATITDGAVGLADFDTSVNKISAIVVLADNKATIQSFTGQSSKGGTFALVGSASLLGGQGLGLRLTASNLGVDENSKQNALAKSFQSALKATINGALTITGPFLTPAVATPADAPIVISNATATLPSPTAGAEAAKTPSTFNPSFDVLLQLGGGRTKTVRVQGGLLQAEAEGRLRLQGSLRAPRFAGTLQVARGQFVLPPSTLLKIVKPRDIETVSLNGNGKNYVSVAYPRQDENGVPSLQTNVNIWAQATVSPSQATLAQYRSVAGNSIGEAAPQQTAVASGTGALSSGRQRYTITVHIYGLLGSTDPAKLHDDFYSSPAGLTKAQMVAALVPASALAGVAGGGAGGQNVLEDQFKTALANVAIPSLLTPITESVASALGLEDVNVTYDPNQPVFVTVTKQLGPKVDVTFSRSFGARGVTDQTLAPPQYTLKLGYDITSRYRIGVSTDEQKNNAVTLEAVIRF